MLAMVGPSRPRRGVSPRRDEPGNRLNPRIASSESPRDYVRDPRTNARRVTCAAGLRWPTRRGCGPLDHRDDEPGVGEHREDAEPDGKADDDTTRDDSRRARDDRGSKWQSGEAQGNVSDADGEDGVKPAVDPA